MPSEQTRKKTRGGRRFGVVCALLIAVAAYIAWPYVVGRKLVSALESGDAEYASAHIDFDSFRSSLKEQMNAAILENVQGDADLARNPFSGLAVAFLPKLVDSLVDAYVTPAGVQRLFTDVRSGSARTNSGDLTVDPDPGSARTKTNKVQSASFVSPTAFKVSTENADFIFRLRDWTWKLSSVHLSKTALESLRTNGAADSKATAEPHWLVHSEKSPIDDSPVVLLSVKAKETKGTSAFGESPTLMIRLKDGDLELFTTVGSYLGSDPVPVTMRLGRDPAVESNWTVSTSGDSVFFPGDGRTFLRELQRHDQIVLRVKPRHGNDVTATFDIRGLSDAAMPLREALQKR